MTAAAHPDSPPERLDERLDVDVLRYSRVWEDEALLAAALDVDPDDDVLAIASAGDNCLALLGHDVRSVTAVDLSPAQLALVDLHRGALDLLDLPDHEVLVGLAPEGATTRSALLARVWPQLERTSRQWFERHPEVVQAGLVRAGRLDRYFAPFQEQLAERPDGLLDDLLSLDAAAVASGRAAEVAHRFREDRALCTWFTEWFGRTSMERHGRDPEQLRHVVGEVGATFLDRFLDHIARVPVADNPYAWRFLTGEDGPGATTLALRDPGRRGLLRARLDRLRLLHGELGEALDGARTGTWSVVAASDLFEYLAPDTSDQLFGTIAERLRPGGRVAWWNLLVPRDVPTELDRVLEPTFPDPEELPRERTWFYGAFLHRRRTRDALVLGGLR